MTRGTKKRIDFPDLLDEVPPLLRRDFCRLRTHKSEPWILRRLVAARADCEGVDSARQSWPPFV